MSTCIIPARGGSRRIPRKAIRPFFGKPIIAYSIETALQVFDRVIVSTNDLEIADVAYSYGVQARIRPAEFCADVIGTQTVMAFVLRDQLEADAGEMCCCMYPCAPLVTQRDLGDATLHWAMEMRSFVVAVAADPLRDIGNFYVGSAGAFMRGTPLYGKATGLYVMPPERAIDINTEEDWKRAEEMYAALKERA